MRLVPVDAQKFALHFSSPIFARDLREGVFGPAGYFGELRTDPVLQTNYLECFTEFETYQIQIKP
jgi:hypothetical protein